MPFDPPFTEVELSAEDDPKVMNLAFLTSMQVPYCSCIIT
jgi:hypothetical protein